MKSAIALNLLHRYTNFLTWLGFSHVKKEENQLFLKKKKQQLLKNIDWTKSTAFTRDHSKATMLTPEDIADILGRNPENFR